MVGRHKYTHGIHFTINKVTHRNFDKHSNEIRETLYSIVIIVTSAK